MTEQEFIEVIVETGEEAWELVAAGWEERFSRMVMSCRDAQLLLRGLRLAEAALERLEDEEDAGKPFTRERKRKITIMRRKAQMLERQYGAVRYLNALIWKGGAA